MESGLPPGVTIRRLGPGDSFEELTALLHRAYAALAALGFNYTAVDQDPAVTRRRATRGSCLVAILDGRVVGTLAMHGPDEQSPSAHFRSPSAVVLEQFAVEPSLQDRGIGRALMEEAERRARAEGARELVGDTAEGAVHLVRWYESMGWRSVGFVQWPGKTYRSVVLTKPLDGA
jgi:GNAT superfamily N-acetyltransferase